MFYNYSYKKLEKWGFRLSGAVGEDLSWRGSAVEQGANKIMINVQGFKLQILEEKFP